MKIGFIGQGFVGKNIANDLENRGFAIVRYSLEEPYIKNKEKIQSCDVVFICVPAPTKPEGFDGSIIESGLSLVGKGKVAVIKSTLPPGTTRALQDLNPDKAILFSPEFLSESTAGYDTAHPMFNIIGISYDSPGHRRMAEKVMELLPRADHNYIISSQAAEIFKYTHNIHGYMRVVFSNMLYDLAQHFGADWADIKPIMDADPMMSPWYNSPIHKSGRGAGGNCFLKDMAAFRATYEQCLAYDVKGISILRSMEEKNLELLKMSEKSQDIVQSVYGLHKAATTTSERENNQEPPIVSSGDTFNLNR